MRSQKSREGELEIDHRASPGLPEDVARAFGYDPALCGEGKVMKTATLTCRHCGVVVVKNPLRTRERPFCFKCSHYICDLCEAAAHHPDYVHLPLAKFIDQSANFVARHGQPMGSPPNLILPAIMRDAPTEAA